MWAGNSTAGTALACAVVCGMTVEQTAAVTDRAMPDAIDGTAGAGEVPRFELWRRRIQQQFSSQGATP